MRDTRGEEGLACEVKEEVPAVGRRRGTFARKPLFPQRSTNLLLCSTMQRKSAAPMFRRPRQERERVEGAGDQNTKLTPATGPLNSCFRPMVPSLPFLSASSLNQS